jgi:hypothetical protein
MKAINLVPPPTRSGRRSVCVVILAASFLMSPAPAFAFELMEATIGDINEACERNLLTAEELVTAYLARIDAYDRQGPEIRALISVNPAAPTTGKRVSTSASSGISSLPGEDSPPPSG